MPKVKTKHSVERFVPYAAGFKAPNSKIQTEATIGCKSESIPKEFESANTKDGKPFFTKLPQPTSIDDWLAQYNEDGQTYRMFLSECPWISKRKRKYMHQKFNPHGKTLLEKYPEGKIYLLPVGEFTEENCAKFSDLAEFAEAYLGVPVCQLPGIRLENEGGQVYWYEQPGQEPVSTKSGRKSQRVKKSHINSRYNSGTKHMQLKLDISLLKLRTIVPDDAICMIGLTMYDLYETDRDLFVAGMAAGNFRVAIFSFFRYDPCLSFSKGDWFDIRENKTMDKSKRTRTILHRSCKLLVHEISHLLGLDHCIYYDCCMNGSGHLQEDFRQPIHLCPVDLRKLHALIGFDVIERYRKLALFYQKHGMNEDYLWVNKRIEFLQES